MYGDDGMIDIAIPLFLLACGLAVIFVRDMLSAIMIFTVYSLVMSMAWVRLNAVDVAITEASVGAGISTVLFLAVLSKTRTQEEKTKLPFNALIITVAVAAILLYGVADLPDLRQANIPPSNHVVPEYLSRGYEETGMLNIVAAILASYRGYDTLGETTVVSTAGFCLILLLRQVWGERKGKEPHSEERVDGD